MHLSYTCHVLPHWCCGQDSRGDPPSHAPVPQLSCIASLVLWTGLRDYRHMPLSHTCHVLPPCWCGQYPWSDRQRASLSMLILHNVRNGGIYTIYFFMLEFIRYFLNTADSVYYLSVTLAVAVDIQEMNMWSNRMDYFPYL